MQKLFTAVFMISLLLLVGVCAAIFINEEIKKRTYRKLLGRVTNAESFLFSSMYDEARKIYDDILAAAKDAASQIIYPDIVAECNYGLGKCYQIWSTDNPEAFVNAIQCYESFLEYYKDSGGDEALEAKKLETGYNLGVLYAAYGRIVQKKDHPEYLRRSEQLLGNSLKNIDIIAHRLFPHESAAGLQTATAMIKGSIYKTLAAIHYDLSETESGSRAESSLKKSIEACHSASQYFTRDDYAKEYAELLEHKVQACARLCSIAESRDNVQQTITTQREFLAFLESNARFSDLFDYYGETGDSCANLARLILGESDNDQNKKAGHKALEEACSSYRKMIKLYDEGRVVVVNADIAKAYHKVGETLIKIYHLGLQETYVTEAFAAFRKALDYVLDGSIEMANIQSMMGNLYVILSKHHDRKANLKEARSAYRTALKIYDIKGLIPHKQYVEAALKQIDIF